ncbi:hypothetical protein B0T10DRAFT_566933 [Thelonectria olida]|uniref:Uncharacterized protein n=1 Tax=Thelonectria olida TaxID=1576542 RepID=A0A9P9ALU0_9HYPO|nr:hypothetical protein B0T10DRAFT_566933 [Thelonectria olida]
MRNICTAKIAMVDFMVSAIRASDTPNGLLFTGISVGSNEQIFATVQVFCQNVNCLDEKASVFLILDGNAPFLNRCVNISIKIPESPYSGSFIGVKVNLRLLIDAVIQRLAYDETIDFGSWNEGARVFEGSAQAVEVNTVAIDGKMYFLGSRADEVLLSDFSKSVLLPESDPLSKRQDKDWAKNRFDRGSSIMAEVLPYAKPRMGLDKFKDEGRLPLMLCKSCAVEDNLAKELDE